MAITIQCPNVECRQKYSIQEESLGRRTTCEKCGQAFTLAMKADETGSAAALGSASLTSTWVPPPPSPTPSKIGPYLVRGRLGGGAMGEVWLAYDPALQRAVAVKTLRTEHGKSADDLSRFRFLREARLAAKLHHTNTVAVYQVGVDNGMAYLAMELIDGDSLDKAVSPGKPMDWREATRAIRDAAVGLAAAHEMGMVHRDLKPSNLMRTKGGITKVVDFGLARVQAASTQLTQQGLVLGTPAYMAPELWQGKEADARSDVYALTSTYYCLLTGRTPFEATTLPALGYQHGHEPVPDPRQHAAGLPGEVCRILAKGMRKIPAKRYQDVASMLAELESLLALRDESLAFDEPWDQAIEVAAGDGPQELNATEASPRARVSPDTVPARGRRTRSHLGPWLSWMKWGGLAGVAAFAVVTLGILVYMWINSGTVRIELSDPKAPAAVKVDGQPIAITDLREPIRLKAGEHALLVDSDGYQSVSRSFTLRRGAKVVLPVALMRTITNSIGMKLVLIPAGEFLMGSPDSDTDAADDEKPQHRVRITRPFYLSVCEVTQLQYEMVMRTNPSHFKGAALPVESVSWYDTSSFCEMLGQKEGCQYRLPTEAEWEFACRAGSSSKWSFGDDGSVLGEYAWYDANSRVTTHPVGEKHPNAWGLYDMHGNVWEWCRDAYDEKYYANSPPDDPTGSTSGIPANGATVSGVVRGGGWDYDAAGSRSASRFRTISRVSRSPVIGFRVVRVATE